MNIKQIVLDLCAVSDEQEWFEFKECKEKVIPDLE